MPGKVHIEWLLIAVELCIENYKQFDQGPVSPWFDMFFLLWE